MGDHRADVKIEFTFHGETRKLHLDWVNYVDGGDGIDDRVREFFETAYTDGMTRYHKLAAAAYRDRHKEEIEAREREELAALKAKYEQPEEPANANPIRG